MDETMICVMCPIGCELSISGSRSSEGLQVTGHACSRGEEFAREEILQPKRNIASSLPIDGKDFHMLSVRLSDRIPGDMIASVMAALSEIRPKAPVRRGDVLLKNIADTGVDLIATRTVL